VLSMFGHMSIEVTDNMATWERDFLLEKTLEYIELVTGKKETT
jgi:hypothetical protein